MNIARITCALLALVSGAVAAEAEVVILRNGDRITGTFLSVRGSNLSLHSDALGVVP